MVEGRTGLNIKDFPFAFSITALFFPGLLTGSSDASIVGLLLIGGMFGSILTIINPLSLLSKWHYRKEYSDSISNIILPDLVLKHNKLTKKIVAKNFNAALSSPAIAFETDKIIAMIYFVFILVLAFVRSFMGDFAIIFDNAEPALWGIRVFAAVGFVGVMMILIHHVYGFNFKTTRFKIKPLNVNYRMYQQSELSQFDRICSVTIANLAIDLANLTNDGQKWKLVNLDTHPVVDITFRELNLVNDKVDREISKNVTISQHDFENWFRAEQLRPGLRLNEGGAFRLMYENYKIVKEISMRYDVTFSEALAWFYNKQAFTNSTLYESESQIRKYIDSRDWYSARLLEYRITDNIQTVLLRKNMPGWINKNWNRDAYVQSTNS